MYQPSHFKEQREPILFELIEKYPFATFVSMRDGFPEVNHLPLLLSDDKKYLRCHIARANPLWNDLTLNNEVLISFHGPHAYITPSWYPSKQEAGKVVPTWNYIVVHVKGIARVIDDAGWVRENVEALTTQLEKTRHSEWKVSDAPKDYLDMMLKATIGIEVEIQSIEGKFKLSQNKAGIDRDGVYTQSSKSTMDVDRDLVYWMNRVAIKK